MGSSPIALTISTTFNARQQGPKPSGDFKRRGRVTAPDPQVCFAHACAMGYRCPHVALVAKLNHAAARNNEVFESCVAAPRVP